MLPGIFYKKAKCVHAGTNNLGEVNAFYIGFITFFIVSGPAHFIIRKYNSISAQKIQVGLIAGHGQYPIVFYRYKTIEILLLCKTIFANALFRVETLSRCENVIDDIHNFKPTLILMDLWIQEIRGEKAIALIKENPATCNIPVFLFSANAEIKEICKKIIADGYIEKLFDIPTFKKSIE